MTLSFCGLHAEVVAEVFAVDKIPSFYWFPLLLAAPFRSFLPAADAEKAYSEETLRMSLVRVPLSLLARVGEHPWQDFWAAEVSPFLRPDLRYSSAFCLRVTGAD